MIFYILFSIHLLTAIIGFVLFIKYRNKPAISYRGLFLTSFTNFLCVACVLCLTISMEDFYFGDFQSYQRSCFWLQGFIAAFSVPAVGLPILIRAFNIQFKYYSSLSKLSSFDENNFYFRHRSLAEPKMNAIILMVFGVILLIPSLVVGGVFPHNQSPLTSTECLFPYQIIYACEAVTVVIFFGYLLLKFINFKDPFGIKLEFAIELAVATCTVAVASITVIFGLLPQQWQPIRFQPLIFIMCFAYLHVLNTFFVPLYFVYLDQRRVKDVGKSSTESIKTILETPQLLEIFKEVVTQHWCSEALLFALEYEEFAKASEFELQTRAQRIEINFIRPGSKFEVNVDVNEVKRISELIKNKQVSRDMFNKVIIDVHSQLKGVIIRWRNSESYKKAMKVYNDQLEKEKTTYLEFKPLQ